MEDNISLTDLAVHTHIGVTADEREAEQTLFVSVELLTDTSKAGKSDDVTDSIDYDAVAKAVLELGKKERNTLEKFAEDAANMILTSFKPHAVRICVAKPNISGARQASVTIVRP